MTLTPGDLEVGQEVLVFDGVRSARHPIIRVGRKLVTIKIWGREQQFRIDTQQFNGDSVGYGFWFRTEEQYELEEKHRADLKEIRLSGFRVDGADKDLVTKVADFLRSLD